MRESNLDYARGVGRAVAGALIFALPLLMTMEMWQLGSSMSPWRLALLLGLFFPFLVSLSWHAGFEDTASLRDDVLDALVAYAVGFISSAVVLWLFGILTTQASVQDAIGKVSLQAVPASIGALLAQAQLGQEKTGPGAGRGRSRYAGEIFIMSVGALFLSFNLAPTDEMVLIAYRMSDGHAIALQLVSVGLMHAFLRGASFKGRLRDAGRQPGAVLFIRFTAVGYLVALLLSAYVLWTFGRLDGLSPGVAAKAVIVLGFPASLGAAAARLIL